MNVHGVIVVDKPSGPSSHRIVSEARRIYGTRAVGHAGTLDPMATGVLLVLLGEATKLSGYLTLDAKTYRARIAFGTSTDSLDRLGRAIESRAVDRNVLEADRVAAALDAERARTRQIPPAVSAIKLDGERAYRRARRGESIELAARDVRVERLDLVELDPSRCVLTLELRVTKGYYVRSLARDVGERLGVPAHLDELRRLSSGGFGLELAVAWPPPNPVPPIPLPDAARRCLPSATLTAQGLVRARAGQALGAEHFVAAPERADVHAWFDESEHLIALGQRGAEGVFSVIRGFTDRAQ